MVKTAPVITSARDIDRVFKKIDNRRRVVSAVDKASTLVLGGLAVKNIANNDKSIIREGFSNVVDIVASKAKSFAEDLNNAGIFKKATGAIANGLDKAIKATPKTKSLVAIGAAAGMLLLSNVRKNNQAKGIIEQGKQDSKVLFGIAQEAAKMQNEMDAFFEEAIIRQTENQTEEELQSMQAGANALIENETSSKEAQEA